MPHNLYNFTRVYNIVAKNSSTKMKLKVWRKMEENGGKE